jgi:acetyl-CoA C-acetyltransferase
MYSNEVYIVSAARTPIGSFLGCYSQTSAADLGSVVIKEVLKRANVDPNDVSEVIMGQSLTAGQGQNPARQASLKAGLPLDCPAYLINMLCGSGLKTAMLGYQSILTADSTIVVAGGQENMTMSPHAINMRPGIKMNSATMLDTMITDGLTDASFNMHMGETAENLAAQFSITRVEQDEQAYRSQSLAKEAIDNGYFDKEIVPVEVTQGRNKVLIKTDEYPKPNTSIESLTKLKPCFIKENGTVTAGNASGINDSAAAVLLMSKEEVEKRAIKPLAKIVAFTQAGVDPKIMGYGPVPAVEKILKKTGWSKDDVDLYELNEAFAAQAISVNKGLGLDVNKVNIHGGAIALGHPIGASGARVLVTLLYALQRTGGKKGIASLCIGGGMGIAIAIELV